MKASVKYALYGAGFGCFFPIFSTLFQAWLDFGNVYFSSLINIQKKSALLWVIDTAPIFLGLFAYLGGRHYENLERSELERERLLVSLQNERDLLEIKVRQRTEELKSALDEAQLATKAKSELMAKISRDLRIPLNGVLGMAQLFSSSQLNQQQAEYVNIIMQSGNSLLTLIDDMLNYAKLDTGNIVVNAMPFDIRNLIRDTLDLFESECAIKNIECSLDYPGDIPSYVLGDAIRINQVISKLLENALTYTDKGSIKIVVTSTAQTNDEVTLNISVSDTGKGIAKQDINKLFNETDVTAGDNKYKLNSQQGLGLAICKQLMKLMNGEIGVKSELNKGSTFWLVVKFVKADNVKYLNAETV